ncbi:MAG: hypothetical protein DSY80_02530, partial [Desulfocapsa sp.]
MNDKESGVIAFFRKNEVIQRFADVVGNKALANSYATSVIIEARNNSDLLECSVDSLYSSAIKAAMLRLQVGATLGEAWLIPRNNKKKINGRDVWQKEANFQIGWKGWYRMAMRTQLYRYINISPMKMGSMIEFNPITGAASVRNCDKIY